MKNRLPKDVFCPKYLIPIDFDSLCDNYHVKRNAARIYCIRKIDAC